MKILVPAGLGELYDKISILEIKAARIADQEKLAHVVHELEELQEVAKEYPIAQALYAELKKTNEQLWDIEDTVRDCERLKDFGERFVAAARAVYEHNDHRAEIKKEINIQSGSDIVEVKSYAKKE